MSFLYWTATIGLFVIFILAVAIAVWYVRTRRYDALDALFNWNEPLLPPEDEPVRQPVIWPLPAPVTHTAGPGPDLDTLAVPAIDNSQTWRLGDTPKRVPPACTIPLCESYAHHTGDHDKAMAERHAHPRPVAPPDDTPAACTWVRELLSCPIENVAVVAQRQLAEFRWAI